MIRKKVTMNNEFLAYISEKRLELFYKYHIIDNHIHIGKGENVWFYPDVDPQKVVKILNSMNIDRAIVFPNYHRDYLSANQEVNNIQSEFSKLYGFGRLNTGRAPLIPWNKLFTGPRNFLSAGLTNHIIRKSRIKTLQEIDKCMTEYKFKGFKIAPGVDGQLSPDEIALINDYNVPLLIHDDPENIVDRILTQFPKTTIILPHMGGYPNHSENYHKAIELAKDYENFYLDISGVMFQYIIHKGITEVPDKIIFGSDLPAEHPAVVAMLLLTTNISETVINQVFSKNIEKIVDFS